MTLSENTKKQNELNNKISDLSFKIGVQTDLIPKYNRSEIMKDIEILKRLLNKAITLKRKRIAIVERMKG